MHKTHWNMSKTHEEILSGLNPRVEAHRFIMNKFPGVRYIEEADSYVFNGHEFDYAFCGYDENEIKYKLVDKEFGDAASHHFGDDWHVFVQTRDFLVNKKFQEEYVNSFSQAQSIMLLLWFCGAAAVVIVFGVVLIT